MNYKENKQVLLALFITLIMMATTIFTYGQTTINTDSVWVDCCLTKCKDGRNHHYHCDKEG